MILLAEDAATAGVSASDAFVGSVEVRDVSTDSRIKELPPSNERANFLARWIVSLSPMTMLLRVRDRNRSVFFFFFGEVLLSRERFSKPRCDDALFKEYGRGQWRSAALFVVLLSAAMVDCNLRDGGDGGKTAWKKQNKIKCKCGL